MQGPELQIELNPTEKQDLAWQYLWDKKTTEIVFGGGAGGGKTRLGAEWILSSALAYPESRWLVGRAELDKLRKTTLRTIFEVARAWNLKVGEKGRPGQIKFNAQDNILYFYNGSEILLADLDYYPSDPEYERFGSYEITGAFVDEVSQITQKAKDTVKSRIRFKLDQFGVIPKLLMGCNPTKSWLYIDFYKPWKEKRLEPDKVFIQALAVENPYNPKSYLESLKNLKDKVLRERLWFGNWEYDTDETILISFDAIADLFSNPVERSGEKLIIVDAARLGADKMVLTVWDGLVITKIRVFDKTRTTEAEEIIRGEQQIEKVPTSRVLVDEDGVGGGIVDHLSCKGFIGNATAIQPPKEVIPAGSEYKVNYQNLRSQCYYTLADYVNARKIKIETEDTSFRQFITEDLEQIRARDVDKDAKLKIIAKEEIKEHLGRSPDFGDTLMMRMYFEVAKMAEPSIRYI